MSSRERFSADALGYAWHEHRLDPGRSTFIQHAALAQTNPRASRVLMVESKVRGSTLRYHKLKLVLVYSAMRH
ncbi:MAG: cryptochrome/photolyase family protein, partial [Chthoniobacterales bacterium]|nr:cryptochrome/photolyase family protein [Chthoniobacterales bacterium]